MNSKELAPVHSQLKAILEPAGSELVVDYFVSAALDRDGHLHIKANTRGLAHLASQLLALAQKPNGSHIHLDEHSGISEGGARVLISKSTEREGS